MHYIHITDQGDIFVHSAVTSDQGVEVEVFLTPDYLAMEPVEIVSLKLMPNQSLDPGILIDELNIEIIDSDSKKCSFHSFLPSSLLPSLPPPSSLPLPLSLSLSPPLSL